MYKSRSWTAWERVCWRAWHVPDVEDQDDQKVWVAFGVGELFLPGSEGPQVGVILRARGR